MPSLQTLPLELRQKIYTLTINLSETTKIVSYPRRSTPNTYKMVACKAEAGQAPSTPVNNTTLLQVSKQVSDDARPIFYGCHKFSFQSTRALELFLDQIGNARQHLRHISIDMGGYHHDRVLLFYATKRSFAMLTMATRLQTLSVSHFDFCSPAYSSQPVIDFASFVDACAQLLHVIWDTRVANGVKVSLASLVNIVKIVLPACVGCHGCGRSGAQMPGRRGVKFDDGISIVHRKCRCKCLEAEYRNDVLLEQLKRGVALRLQLE